VLLGIGMQPMGERMGIEGAELLHDGICV